MWRIVQEPDNYIGRRTKVDQKQKKCTGPTEIRIRVGGIRTRRKVQKEVASCKEGAEMKERLGTTAYNYVEEEELRSTKSKRNAQVLPRFELGLEESEPEGKCKRKWHHARKVQK